MGVEQRGRHTLRWCPESATIVETASQTPGAPCPACGRELPPLYAPAEDRPKSDGYIRNAEAFSYSIAPDQAAAKASQHPGRTRRWWEGPAVIVVSIAAVFTGLVLFSADRPDVATIDAAEVEAGFTAHERPNAGFAIALPSSWTVADLGPERLLDPAGDAAAQMSPDTLGQFQTLTAAGVPFELLAYGEDEATGFSMISRSRARTDTIDRVKYSVESALMWSYGILDPGFQLQDVDGHDTLRFTYTIPALAGNIYVVQYIVMRNDELLTARFHEMTADLDLAYFDTIVGTLRTTG